MKNDMAEMLVNVGVLANRRDYVVYYVLKNRYTGNVGYIVGAEYGEWEENNNWEIKWSVWRSHGALHTKKGRRELFG